MLREVIVPMSSDVVTKAGPPEIDHEDTDLHRTLNDEAFEGYRRTG
jgi:hypothetical protein